MFRGTSKNRIKRVKALFLIILIALCIRIVQIQFIKGAYYEGLADDQYYYSPSIFEQKFQLLDSNGVYLNKRNRYYKLVINRRLFKLNDYEANLDKIMIMNLAIKRVNEDFNLDDILKEGYGDVYLELDKEGYANIKEISKYVKGIFTYSHETIDNSKSWPIENILSTIYKYEDKKPIRKADDSLEVQIDTLTMENSVARAKFQVEKSGFILPAGFVYPEMSNVNLTLDNRLQNKIKAIMESDEFKNYHNIGAVLIEASTGKVKALVQKFDTLPNINLAATGAGYEVGSTFKLMLAELGLENKVITENSIYICQGDKCYLNGKKNPHGKITLNEALKHSCNDFFIDLAKKFTYDEIKSFSEGQGFFSKVLNIEQEVPGKFPELSSGESNINIAMGNSTSNPVQVASTLTAILNDGTFVKPYIIDSISDNKGNIIEKFETERKNVISKETAEVMKKAIRAAVQGGTGYRANIASLEIGGKTGTSGTADGKAGNGWFAGYYKQDDKYYILTVLVPELDKLPEINEGYTGGSTAAVVFREIVKAINQE